MSGSHSSRKGGAAFSGPPFDDVVRDGTMADSTVFGGALFEGAGFDSTVFGGQAFQGPASRRVEGAPRGAAEYGDYADRTGYADYVDYADEAGHTGHAAQSPYPAPDSSWDRGIPDFPEQTPEMSEFPRYESGYSDTAHSTYATETADGYRPSTEYAEYEAGDYPRSLPNSAEFTHGEYYAPYAENHLEYADPYSGQYADGTYPAESDYRRAYDYPESPRFTEYPSALGFDDPEPYPPADPYSLLDADTRRAEGAAAFETAEFEAAFEAEFGAANGYESRPAPDYSRPDEITVPSPRRPASDLYAHPYDVDGREFADTEFADTKFGLGPVAPDVSAPPHPAPPDPTTDLDGEQAGRPGSGHRSGTRRTGSRPKVSPAGKAVRGLVLAALIGGVGTYMAMDKTITLSVDGSTTQIHSFAGTVGAVLAAQDIATGRHDLVTPSPSAGLVSGTTIVVRYGRPVTVTVDGMKEHVWVHAGTVGGALQELGVRTVGARTSEPLSTRLGRRGGTFWVYTMRHITFLVDGKTEQIETTAATVTQAMAQAGITLHNQDTPSVPVTSVPTQDEIITILRISGATEQKQISIPYQVTKIDDANQFVGTSTVITTGQDGIAQITYEIETVNGVAQPPKKLAETVLQQPVTEVIQVGTEPLPANAANLNWAALAQCESGGNPQAVDPSGTYFGLYQFSVATWDSLGGTGLPSQASPTEQTDLAELLYERAGSGQWPVCGHNLFT